jgi:hypothetical protein
LPTASKKIERKEAKVQRRQEIIRTGSSRISGVLLEGDCQIPVSCGNKEVVPRNMARIWQSELSTPENPREPKNFAPWRLGDFALNLLLVAARPR